VPILTLFTFLFLAAAFVSLWIRQDPKIWGSLLGLSLLSGLIAGNIAWIGLIFIIALLLLWLLYDRKPIPGVTQELAARVRQSPGIEIGGGGDCIEFNTTPSPANSIAGAFTHPGSQFLNHSGYNAILFILIVCFSAAFQMRLFPGYTAFCFTPHFAIDLEAPLIGLFPLAFLALLARNVKDWISVIKGTLIGCAGIAILAIVATASGATTWQFKVPTFAAARLLSNLFLTCIPEEGFYRGFIQNTFCKYFENVRLGKILALVATSILFTAAHIYWSPSVEILAFVFLASLLYGGVYLISGKLESAILCHFLLNAIHMMFFSYHAM